MTMKNTRPSLSEFTPRKVSQPSADNKRPLSNHEIEKNLRASLVATDDGLKKFLASMKQSGMQNATQSYRAMQMVLIQQRLWADEHHREQLLPLFRSIAQTADELHRIFASFADVMKPLKELDKLRSPTVAQAPSKT